MQPSTSRDTQSALPRMWDAHRDFVRRLLIGLARNIDLADDLLQESYLKARAGIDGYRGGDARAWLSAVAKSTFYSHVRRRYVRCETPLDEQTESEPARVEPRINRIEVRRALSDLPEALRTALVMKHYGGYSYDEIAERMGCPAGTAKSRVNAALKRLRCALAAAGEEPEKMKCADLNERRLLDYVCDKASEQEAAQVERHLAGCATCRARAAELRLVLRALDAVESDYKVTLIIDIHEDGTTTDYMVMSFVNDSGETIQTLDGSGDCAEVSFADMGGEEVRVEPLPEESGQEMRRYKLHVARPIAPGERAELLMVGKPIAGHGAKPVGEGLWRFGPAKMILTEEFVYVLAVRLPSGAELAQASPEPQEVRRNGAATVVWRNVLPPNQEFEFAVEYRLAS